MFSPTPPPTRRTLLGALLLLPALACGSSPSGASSAGAGAGTAAPTAQESDAAESSSAATRDAGDASGAASAPSTSRAASAAAAGSIRRARCLAAARAAGGALDANHRAGLEAHLRGNFKGGLGKGSVGLGAQVGLGANINAGLEAQSAAAGLNLGLGGGAGKSVAPTVDLSTMIFDKAACTFDDASQTGNQIIVVAASGTAGTYVVQVASDLDLTLKNGEVVHITSADPNFPTYEMTTTLDAAAAQRTYQISLNERRVGTDASGKEILDVTTQAMGNASLDISETLTQVAAADVGNNLSTTLVADGRTVTSGTTTSVHALAKFTATHTFTNLHHDLASGCRCPVSGSLAQSVTSEDGTRQATHTYTFTGCGQATVASSVKGSGATESGTSSVTWKDCS